MGGCSLAALLAMMIVALPGRAAAAAAREEGVNDPYLGRQWGLDAINAPAAWRLTTGLGTTIAIIDSGADLEHEDLAERLVPDGNITCVDTKGEASRCQVGGYDDGRDGNGHGTHVAGVALASANNGRGIAGVAPAAGLITVRVLGRACGTGAATCQAQDAVDDVTAGIRFAADQGATVINLSLGDATEAVLGAAGKFQDAIRYAWGRGSVPVVAADNDVVLSPGFSDEPVLVVGALNRSGQAATYSNGVGAARWALSAPGGEADTESSCDSDAPNGILSTAWMPGSSGDQYRCLSGTSTAVPHVSGAVALLRSLGLSPEQAVQRLLETARDLGLPGPDPTYGAGAIDLAQAVGGLGVPASNAAPAPTTTPAIDGSVAAAPADSQLVPGGGIGLTPAAGGSASADGALLPNRSPEQVAPREYTIEATQPGGVDRRGWTVNVAVLMVSGAGAAHAWVLVRRAEWGRRTREAGW